MNSLTCRLKRFLLCLLPFLLVAMQSGCSYHRSKSEIAGALSDYWKWRAERARFAEAKAEHDRSEKAKAEAHAYSEGTVEEVVSTDYTITLEKGMEIESMSLDFDEIEKMKAQQAKLDTEYQKAKAAYDKLQANAYRQQLANAQANAEAEMNGACGCAPMPSCAQPPEQELALGPPPQRKALGMENLPIVIRARYSISPRQTAHAKTAIERRYQPGKAICEPPCEPCCPRCGDTRCTRTGACAPSSNYVDSMRGQGPYQPVSNEPAAAPPSEVLQQSSPPQTELEGIDFDSSAPFTARSTLFDGELAPLLLSHGG